jgi:hypothetical protein
MLGKEKNNPSKISATTSYQTSLKLSPIPPSFKKISLNDFLKTPLKP